MSISNFGWGLETLMVASAGQLTIANLDMMLPSPQRNQCLSIIGQAPDFLCLIRNGYRIFLYIFVFLLVIYRGYEKLLCTNEEKPNHGNRNMSKVVFLRGKGSFGVFYSLIILKQLLS
jgi:hypothetical protein